jgi:hypothetical protein
MGKSKIVVAKSATPAKKRSSHFKAGLKLPVSRVRTNMRKTLKGYYLSSLSPITATAFYQEMLRAFVAACISKMTEKELAKATIKAHHCAAAGPEFAGIFPVPVAGIFQKESKQ